MSATSAPAARTRSAAAIRTDCSCEPASSTTVSRAATRVDDHLVTSRATDRRHCPELEVGIIPPEVVLAREVNVLLAAAGDVSDLAFVQSARGRQDRTQVPLGGLDDERLGDVVRPEPERFSFGERRLGVGA